MSNEKDLLNGNGLVEVRYFLTQRPPLPSPGWSWPPLLTRIGKYFPFNNFPSRRILDLVPREVERRDDDHF